MLSYAWQGIEEAQHRLSALAGLAGLDSELETGADTIVTEAQAEPPERPGQRYARSHRLSGAWKRSDARRSSGSVIVDVTNDTPYGLFVQGEDQAEIHRGRWKRLKVIGDEQRGVIRARVQAWAVKTWRGG
jgi:hypothetical protein